MSAPDKTTAISSLPPKADVSVESFEQSVMDALKSFHGHIQKESLPDAQKELSKVDFAGFLKYMGSAESDALSVPPKSEYNLPISSYFISTSHNTYLTGHQLYGKATVDGYKNVLLRGCRCVEIDCWDGESSDFESGKSPNPPGLIAEPVVLHGHTATREITFRSVCETIKQYAFVTSDLPVIVSLEVHTNREQQQLMVDIMNDCFQEHLCPTDISDWKDPGPPLPSPEALKKKILIKVKYSPPNADPSAPEDELKTVESHVSELTISDEEPPAKDQPKHKVSKIIEALSQMGVYTRSYHFGGFTKAEARIPTHVFSLSETSLIGVHKNDPQGLFDHNKNFLMRAYPKGTRIASSNLDPSLFWRAGVQMVALNWQRIDKGMMLQEAMFQGTGGWAEKPTNHLSTATYQDSLAYLRQGISRFQIAFYAAQNIPCSAETSDDKIRPYVKCEIHVDVTGQDSHEGAFRKNKDLSFKKTTNAAKGRNPRFSEKDPLIFGNLPPLVPQLSFARFKVMNDKFGPDEFLAWACIRLDRLTPGLRFIHLNDFKGNPNGGVLLAKIDFEWNGKK